MIEVILKDADLQIYLSEVPEHWPENSFLLSEAERTYCLESKHESLQLSRAHLRLMTKDILHDASLEVQRGPLGRPVVSSEVDISFSHKHGMALVGVTGAPARIGVDLESTHQKIDWQIFTKNFFSQNDLASIESLSRKPGWDSHLAHLAHFSLKEAFFKAMDLHLEPRQLEIQLLDCNDQRTNFQFFYKKSSFQSDRDHRLFSLLYKDHLVSVCELGRKRD